MPTTVADVLILLAAAIGSGSMVGVGMWLYYRVKRLEGENWDLVKLTGQIDDLSHQVEQVQGQFGEMQERLDFTERMLVQGRDKPQQLSGGAGPETGS